MDDFRTPGDGSFSLGSRTWPGLSKLVEECGEVLQIAGKIMGTGGRGAGKDIERDLREAVDSINRALQMIAEDDV